MAGGGGPQSSGSSQGYSRPLSERAHPAQWALYGPLAAQLFEKAFGGDRDRQITETGLRTQALQGGAGASRRLTGVLAGQGVNANSPLFGSLQRGLQGKVMDQLAEARLQGEKAQRATQAGWGGLATKLIGDWPPAESWSTSQQQSSGGGGGK
jgi:hypothetical protein